MPEEPKKTEEETRSSISRREFLKDAGLIVGGATVGSMALVNACNSTTTVTAPGATSTVTKTTTVAGPGGATVTVTQPGGTGVVTTTITSPAATGAVGMPSGVVALKVNGTMNYVTVEPDWSLAHALREELGLFGLKVGCDRGECGTCTILVDGKTVYACTMLACEAEGKDIQTIEGLSSGSGLSSIQQVFRDNDAFQCGYCTPGQIMSAVALLKKTPKPTLDQIKEAMSGNLCWCGNYTNIAKAIQKAGG